MFYVGPLIPLFWTSGDIYPSLGPRFQSQNGFRHSLAGFFTYMQWIPHIHLWCNTCRLLGGQHDSRAVSIHILANNHRYSRIKTDAPPTLFTLFQISKVLVKSAHIDKLFGMKNQKEKLNFFYPYLFQADIIYHHRKARL